MFVKNMQDIPLETVGAGERTSRQVLISPQEGPNFAMRRFIIEADGHMPLHTNTVEHEQLVLRGKAEVVIGDEILQVEKDNVVLIPAGVPHSYRTLGDEPFEFLCMVPNKEDIIDIIP